MSVTAENFEKLLARLRAPRGGMCADVYARAAAIAILLFASSLFMLFCAARINAECTISEAASGAPARGSEIMDEAKKFALDRVLYEDFRKSANDSKRAAGALSPVFVMNVPDGAQSARRMPGYAPTVILKALAVLGGESVCVLDIDGEEPGRVFRAGDVFGDGRGRVVKINADGVTWRWADREYAAGL